MLQGFGMEEGKHFSNCKDHDEQIVIIIIEGARKSLELSWALKAIQDTFNIRLVKQHFLFC